MLDARTRLLLDRFAHGFGAKAQETCSAMCGIPMQHYPHDSEHTHRSYQGIVVSSFFSGAVQGMFLFALEPRAARDAFGADISQEDGREDFFEFLREVLNATCAQTLPELEGELGELTYSPPLLIEGVVHYPDFATAHLDLALPGGHILQCAIFLNLAEVKIGLTLQRTQKALEESSHNASRDRLTQLYNRNAFDQYYPRMVRETLDVPESQLGMLWIDADHFKEINDTYGHLAGDLALQRIASAIQYSVRDSDKAFRYGGDEFVALLPGAYSKQTCMVSDRIYQYLRLNPLKLEHNGNAHELVLQVSIGVTSLRSDDSAESLLLRADRLLYVAKQKGRGQAACDQGTS